MKTKITFLSLFLLLLSTMSVKSQVTYTVNVPEGTYCCYIVSDRTGSGAWKDADFVEMQRVGETNVFTIDIPTASATDWVTFAAGPGWAYMGHDSEGKEAFQGGGPHTIATWLAVYNPTPNDITITINVPLSTQEVYISGDYNGWIQDPDVNRATKVSDGVFRFTFLDVVGVATYYVYNHPSLTGYEELDADNQEVERYASYPTDNNSTITVAKWKNPIITNDVAFNSDFIYNISISDNRVKISNYHGILNLMNLTGQIVQQEVVAGDYVSPYLHHGIYIISLDNVSRKIMIHP